MNDDYFELEKKYLDMFAANLGMDASGIDDNFIDGTRKIMYGDASVSRKISRLNDKLLSYFGDSN